MSKAVADVPHLQRQRLSEFIAGGAALGFAAFSTYSASVAKDIAEGPTAKAAMNMLMLVTVGNTVGFFIVIVISIYASSDKFISTNSTVQWETIGDYIFLISSFVAAVAIGGVFPDMSLVDVYQTSQRKSLIDQSITVTWFVGAWTVIWGIMRAWNVSIRRRPSESAKIPETKLLHTDSTTPKKFSFRSVMISFL